MKNLDILIFNWINHWPHTAQIDQAMVWIEETILTFRFDLLFIILFVLGLVLLRKKLWLGSFFLYIGFCLTERFGYFLKTLFGRQRPYSVLENVHRVGHASGSCFPAVLAMTSSFVSVFMILFGPPKLRWFWVGLIIFFGFFRIYSGVHYPGDILAGWALGTFLAVIFYVITMKFDQILSKFIPAKTNSK